VCFVVAFPHPVLVQVARRPEVACPLDVAALSCCCLLELGIKGVYFFFGLGGGPHAHIRQPQMKLIPSGRKALQTFVFCWDADIQ
jgi:hypothetical protein